MLKNKLIPIKMTTNFISKITVCFLMPLILFSCESQEQNIDDAFAEVKKEKMFLEDSINDSQEMVNDSLKTTVVQIQQITVNNWTVFIQELDKKIIKNEQIIAALKSTPNYSIKLLKKVASLEENNSDLKRKVTEYQNDEKLKMEDFKKTILIETKEIDTQLNEMNINNKK